VDVRLIAPEGYQARPSHSIASAPEGGFLVLTVEHLEDGEVSSYLTRGLRAGDQLELRGPTAGYFGGAVTHGPVLVAAGGSGIVRFRSMLRQRAAINNSVGPDPFLTVIGRRDLPRGVDALGGLRRA
jgi:ferredoxin-NADP reductase